LNGDLSGHACSVLDLGNCHARLLLWIQLNCACAADSGLKMLWVQITYAVMCILTHWYFIFHLGYNTYTHLDPLLVAFVKWQVGYWHLKVYSHR
jgi:hypothetical protein